MCTAELINHVAGLTRSERGCEVAMRIAPAVVESVPKLRAFAQATVREWGQEGDTVDALGLIITELVANACQHSGSTEVAVLLVADPGRVVAQVADTGRWKPSALRSLPDDEATSGRGLQLVRACAADVQVERSSHGTSVTVALSACPLPAAPADQIYREGRLREAGVGG
jgi:anti-sigma regulatory factor (Ser/Thr protein kinase)